MNADQQHDGAATGASTTRRAATTHHRWRSRLWLDVDDEPATAHDPDDDWADWVDSQQLAARVRSLASAPRRAVTGLVVPALVVASVAYRAQRQAYARIP